MPNYLENYGLDFYNELLMRDPAETKRKD